jgi:RHS repeat-associated protein
MTDSTGTVVWEGDYKPFGEAGVHPQSTVVNNFRFAGQYYDEETGLHYNYHRYYDPKTGRYLTPDPIGLLGGINLYSYAVNNPVNAIDPFGLETKGKGLSINTSLLGGTGSYSLLWVDDSQGDFGLSISHLGGGATELAGVGVYFVADSTTTANSINDLNGVSGVVGLGADKVLGYNFEYEIGPGYTGKSHLMGVDFSVVPWNVYGGVSSTKVYNFSDMLDNLLDFLFGDSTDCK